MTMEHLKFGLYGLGVGLLVAVAVWIAGWWRQRSLRAEVQQLRKHLHTQMEITHEGSEQRKVALEELREQNENLRMSVKGLQQKPGRAELRMLHVYDRAVHRLLESTPGFSIAWEAALKDAEEQVAEVDQGLVAFAKRLILPSSNPNR